MRPRNLLLILLLYFLLVWIWSARSYTGGAIVDHGLLWSAIGVGAVLALVIGTWCFSWLRQWWVRRAARPIMATAKVPEAEPADHATLRQLMAEADARLRASPEYGMRRNVRLYDLPITLVVGPPGVGKTGTLLNSGVEPHLLAGQTFTDAGIAPTQVANFFVTKQGLLIEICGRIWRGDVERWRAFLRCFLPVNDQPWWKRLLADRPDPLPRLRAVALFEELPGAVSKAGVDEVGKLGREAQERLQTLSEVFGVVAPVYVIFTNTDAVPYFADFFGRLPDADTAQALGVWTGAFENGREAPTADAETKRLTKAFGAVGFRLADRRVAVLVRESDPARKPGVYEFPREFRRLRSLVVQFLASACKPDPLKVTHVLRGFYFSGTRQVEAAALLPQTNPGGATGASMGVTEVLGRRQAGATQIFRPEATQIFRPDDPQQKERPGATTLRPQWLFVKELLQSIIPGERAIAAAAPRRESRWERYHQAILAGTAAVCVVLLMIWLQSWWLNRSLLSDLHTAMRDAATIGPEAGRPLSAGSLNRLEAMRKQLERLEKPPSMAMRWGLYAGYRVRPDARMMYYRKFDDLILNDLNSRLGGHLGRLPGTPSPADPASPAYDYLATHVAITGASCQPAADEVARVLKEEAASAGLAGDPSSQVLVDRQIDFFAPALARRDVPVHVAEDVPARDHARAYLKNVMNPERVYCSIIAEANDKFRPVLFSAVSPEFGKALQILPREKEARVSRCPEQALPADGVAGAYTRQAADFVGKEAQKRTRAGFGDPCVLGSGGPSIGSGALDSEKAILRLYVGDYTAQWRSLLSRASVPPYGGIGDAIQKLDKLSSYNSPLLGLLAFVSDQTYYVEGVAPSAQETLSRITEKAKSVSGLGQKVDETEKKLLGKDRPPLSPESLARVTAAFEAVQRVVPAASEQWKNEKNAKYLAALGEIQQGLVEMARAGRTIDPAANQRALAAYDKARGEWKALTTDELKPLSSEGTDELVRSLLEQPIVRAKRLIPDNPDEAAAGKVRKETSELCGQMRGVLSKYPFTRSGPDSSLQEVAKLLAPETGEVWQYVNKSLGALVVKQGNRWVQKPDADKVRPSDDLLRFLNRAQELSDAFFSGGGGEVRLHYTLRPQHGAVDRISIILEFDGRTVTFAQGSQLQTGFVWPAPKGMPQGAQAREMAGGIQFPFARNTGLWGVFRVFADAEPRAIGDKNVEWKYVRGAGNERSTLDQPVRLQFVEFPGGIDLFNPEFFRGLACPATPAAGR